MAMATRVASVSWAGDLTGSGELSLESSGVLTNTPVTWASRTEAPEGRTSPEELLAAAHASCYAMAFSNILASFGSAPESIRTTAAVTFDPPAGITGSHLRVEAKVPGISEADFQRLAEDAKATCPVSRALVGIPITIEAHLA